MKGALELGIDLQSSLYGHLFFQSETPIFDIVNRNSKFKYA